jgi:hypothetical protein
MHTLENANYSIIIKDQWFPRDSGKRGRRKQERGIFYAKIENLGS